MEEKPRPVSLIGSSAHFIVCGRCKEHGRIVTARGRRLPEVHTKDLAFMVLEETIKLGFITSDEAKIVREMIQNSPLPERFEDADLLLSFDVFMASLEKLKDILESEPGEQFLNTRECPEKLH